MKQKSKYVDKNALIQIIGILYKEPSILEDENYKFQIDDFYTDFHKILFSSIYNIYQLGAKEITLSAIEDYLTQRPKQLAEYKAQGGPEYLLRCAEVANPQLLDFYYKKIKKFSLLRAYESIGMDMSWLLDMDNILDLKKKEKQENEFDNMTLEDIANLINDKIDTIKGEYVDKTEDDTCSIGEGISEMIESLKKSPDLGIPLYGKYINTVTRGARLGKFYLRSAPTNVGKTRAMIGDACYIGCSEMYDLKSKTWISIGVEQPTLFIATEQSLNEIQTMALAFISGVEETHIQLSEYEPGEIERIDKAIEILKDSKLLFKSMPDFSLQDVENIIKKNIRENEVKYVFFDYIHTSLGILAEIANKSGGVKLREDNVLFMMAVKIKDICTQYDVFIMSSTQLNSDWQTSETPDQNLLRGAKAIADKIDWGAIMLEVTQEDLEKIKPILVKNNFDRPNVKMSLYKNRANSHKGEYMFMKAEKGICRFDTMFITDWNFKLLDVIDMKIKVEEKSAF